MGKTSIIAGIIVAAGVAWTGSSWYFGTQIEKHLDDYLVKSNQYLEQEADGQVKIEKISFTRGIFSSQAIFKMRFNVPQLPQFPKELTAQTQIQHGPIPLRPLLNGEFFTGYAITSTSLLKDEQNKLIYDAAGGKEPYTQKDRIDFSGTIHSNATVAALTATADNFTFQSQPIKMRSVSNTDLNASEAWAELPEMIVTAAPGSEIKYVVKNGNLHINTKKAPSGNYEGDALVAIDSLEINKKSGSEVRNDALAFDKLKVSVKNKEMGDYLNVGIGYDTAKLRIGDADFGALKFNLAFDHLDLQALEKFKMQTELSLQSTTDPAKRVDESSEFFEELMTSLVRGKMQIHVSEFDWRTPNGESHAQASLRLDGADIPGKLTVDNTSYLLRSIESADLNLDADMNVIEDVVTATAQVSNTGDKDSARRQGKESVELVTALIEESGIARIEGGKIQTRIGFDANQEKDEQISLNSEKMSVFHFIGKVAPGLFGVRAPQP